MPPNICRSHACRAKRKKRVIFVAFPGVVLLDLAGPWEVFNCANVLSAGDDVPYHLELLSVDAAEYVESDGGMSLVAHRSLAAVRDPIDTLVVPAASGMEGITPDQAQTPQFMSLVCRSRRIAGICGGAFFLAAAGLLAGRKATTHWQSCERLASQYPDVTVEDDAIFVRDSNIYTSAGVTAGIDLALALVEEDLGREVALNIARHLVMFVRRPGGQTQFSAALESQCAEREPLNELIGWATDNPSADLSIEALAAKVHMSVRNFSRVFRREVGKTPGEFIERMRVDAARQKLEGSAASVDQIAQECGLGSADSMRRVFLRVIKVTPSQYRSRFRRKDSADSDYLRWKG